MAEIGGLQVSIRQIANAWRHCSETHSEWTIGLVKGPSLCAHVMLVHRVHPECAPTHSARPTGHPDQVECPLQNAFSPAVSPGHRDLSNGYLQTADFGHYVKRIRKSQRSARILPFANLFFLGFAAYLDIIPRKRRRRSKIALRSFR